MDTSPAAAGVSIGMGRAWVSQMSQTVNAGAVARRGVNSSPMTVERPFPSTPVITRLASAL